MIVQHCINTLMMTGLVNCRMANLDPNRIKTPELIAIKFVTGNYIQDTKPSTRFGANPSMLGFWANG